MLVLRRRVCTPASGVRDSLVTIRFTEAADGDFAVASDGVDHRRQRVERGRWTWLAQVHGADVVDVGSPGQYAGATADASVTAVPGAVLAVQTADCVPVVLWSPEGVVAAAHAGWRGAQAGVVEAAVRAVWAKGASKVYGVVGPHIHARSYEFSADDAAALADTYGSDVITCTQQGTTALDTNLVVRRALHAAGAVLDADVDRCTSDLAFYSHRVRRDSARQTATVVVR